jgi:hypothetical protein
MGLLGPCTMTTVIYFANICCDMPKIELLNVVRVCACVQDKGWIDAGMALYSVHSWGLTLQCFSDHLYGDYLLK